jgi:hypothetical protein
VPALEHWRRGAAPGQRVRYAPLVTYVTNNAEDLAYVEDPGPLEYRILRITRIRHTKRSTLFVNTVVRDVRCLGDAREDRAGGRTGRGAAGRTRGRGKRLAGRTRDAAGVDAGGVPRVRALLSLGRGRARTRA